MEFIIFYGFNVYIIVDLVDKIRSYKNDRYCYYYKLIWIGRKVCFKCTDRYATEGNLLWMRP